MFGMGITIRRKSKQPLAVSARQVQRRKIANMRKKAERELDAVRSHALDVKTLRSPRVIIAILIVLIIVGGALVSKVDRTSAAAAISLSRAQKNVNHLATALAQFHYNTGRWPYNEEGLPALMRDPGAEGWAGPYIRRLRADIWDVPYGYRAPNPEAGQPLPLIFSCGPDRLAFSADDVTAEASYFDLTTHDPTMFWTNRQETVGQLRQQRDRGSKTPSRTPR